MTTIAAGDAAMPATLAAASQPAKGTACHQPAKGTVDVARCESPSASQPANGPTDAVQPAAPPPSPSDEINWLYIAAAKIQVSLESFSYYLCELTKEELLSRAYLHLFTKDKFSSKVSSMSNLLLLSGPPGSQIYQETLAMALAKEFDASFLKFDPIVVTTAESGLLINPPPNLDLPRELGPVVVFLSNNFFRALEKCATTDPALEKCATTDPDSEAFCTKWSSKLKFGWMPPYATLVIVSRVEVSPFDVLNPSISRLFPTNVTVRMPRDQLQASILKHKLDLDCQTLTARTNFGRILSVLRCAGWTCGPNLDLISINDEFLTMEMADQIVGFAISHRLKNEGFLKKKRVLSGESIKHSLKLVKAIRDAARRGAKKSIKEVVADNKFETRLMADVVQPEEMGFTFDDVGALDNVKDALRETVMLPLQRPELFRRGRLTKPCKGMLLFGPPGTGKTMIAKAAAKEAGANFINVSMSSITSEWDGQTEKYIRAVFTLASKLAPCIIFVDEVDSMLSSRSRREQESSRKMKNEFMTNWDGLRTKDCERVLVLGATNRPFDLDEAVVRRFSRRLMVGLPDSSNREKILRAILSEEELAPDVDLAAIANMTDGYSGSDLKQLCVVAAHRPIREILEAEEKERNSANDGPDTALHRDNDGLRPLEMNDFIHARENVAASSSSTSRAMSELLEWNNTYGEGGSRKKQVLTYFL